MKIVVVTPYFIPHRGGIGTVVHEIGKKHVRMGHEVTIICPDYGDEYLENLDGMKIIRVPGNDILSKVGINFPLVSISMMRWLEQYIPRADVIHIHGFLFLSSLYSKFVASKYRKPIVLTEHVGYVKLDNALFNCIETTSIKLIGKLLFQTSEIIIACSSRVVRELIQMGVEPWRIRFIKNSVDTTFFTPVSNEKKYRIRRELNLPEDKPLVIFVGRFVKKKGVIPLVNCKRQGYHLLMIGEGINVSHSIFHSDSLTIKRPIPQEELVKYYQASDIFVLPSLYEGFPLTALEAMACGLPMVLGNDPTYKDYLDPSKYEAVNQDFDSIEKGIQSFINNEGKRKECAIYGRKRVMESMQWDEIANTHLKVYEEAITRCEVKRVWQVPATDLATVSKLPSIEKILPESKGSTVLDAGCGSGFLGNFLFGTRKRILCDRSLNNLIAARTRAYFANTNNIMGYVCCDLSHLPFKSDAFGSIFCSEVLEHLPSADSAISELCRCTSKDGDIVVTVPHWPHEMPGLIELLKIKTVHDRAGLEYHYRKGFTANELHSMFSKEGFLCKDLQGFFTWRQRCIIDVISIIHLLYQKVCFRKREWEWSTMLGLEKTFAFSMYRRLFPLLKILSGKHFTTKKDTYGGLAIRYTYDSLLVNKDTYQEKSYGYLQEDDESEACINRVTAQ